MSQPSGNSLVATSGLLHGLRRPSLVSSRCGSTFAQHSYSPLVKAIAISDIRFLASLAPRLTNEDWADRPPRERIHHAFSPCRSAEVCICKLIGLQTRALECYECGNPGANAGSTYHRCALLNELLRTLEQSGDSIPVSSGKQIPLSSLIESYVICYPG
jgi:hypothetical protein